MRIVVLAGGFGTRLKGVVSDLPKPMAPVHGKHFLEVILENFKQQGFKEFTFCLYYMADKIMDYFGDGSRFGIKIDYSIEEEPLGTGGAIGLLRDKIRQTFCVVNADTYIRINLQDGIRRHKEMGTVATMALATMDHPDRYGLVDQDGEGYIVRFQEKGQVVQKSGWINAGLYILEPQVFEYLPEGQFVSLEKDVFPLLLKEAKIYGYTKVNDFFDIGVPEDYDRFKKWMKDQNQG